MASLEDMMAGLFGSNMAPGLEDERRRRNAPGGGGYEGIGGAMVTPGMMMPYYSGLPTYDFSGAMGRDFGQGGGLQSMLSELQGPALRHFARQGFDFSPPGQDNRNKPGGPNIAPGNIDNAQALFQPEPDVPGVPQGVARGFDQAPGQMRPQPHTQGWRNVAPGYSAAAQFGYGTDQFAKNLGLGGGRNVGAPAAAQAAPPGATGRQSPGGAGGAPVSQNAIGGGNQQNAPAGPRGGGGQGTAGGGGGGKKTGGAPAGVTPAVKAQAAGQSTARGGTGGSNLGISSTAGKTVQAQRQNARKNRYKNAQAGNASGSFGDTIHVAPNAGNNNTPSETGGAIDPGKLAGLSPQEKAARKAAWEAKVAAKQERARVKAAPSASQFGANSATNDRGTGLEPLPKAGKTKPTAASKARRDPRQR